MINIKWCRSSCWATIIKLAWRISWRRAHANCSLEHFHESIFASLMARNYCESIRSRQSIKQAEPLLRHRFFSLAAVKVFILPQGLHQNLISCLPPSLVSQTAKCKWRANKSAPLHRNFLGAFWNGRWTWTCNESAVCVLFSLIFNLTISARRKKC